MPGCVFVDEVVAQVEGLKFGQGGFADVVAAVTGDAVVVCVSAGLPR